eukprot:TRINITY_DN41_c0_g1_i8.p2 TRINITY_DN41_c0_g1~~TRINITY_DN41_c0_g1_i8.p2  ORF type:complete len:172 (-),score=24.59 TRINITY_DN41_c0_g1_i8:377-892(-)
MFRVTNVFVLVALLSCASLASAGYLSQTENSWIGNPGKQGTPICLKSSSGQYLTLDTSSLKVVPGSSCSTYAQWGAQLFFGSKTVFWLKSIPEQTFMGAGFGDGLTLEASANNGGFKDLWQFYDANDDGSFVMEVYQSGSPATRYYIALGTSGASTTTDINSATEFTVQIA